MTAPTAPQLAEANAPSDPSVEAAFLATPEALVAEILDGKLFTSPHPGRLQTSARSALGGELHAPFGRAMGGPGGWVPLDQPEIHLGPRPDIVVPDIAAWRRERMTDALGPEDAPPYYDIAPDWACEILSPSTEAIDRGKKMRIYRREGVRNVWLINPLAKTLEVYRLEGEHWLLLDTYEDDSVVRAEPFDAIELSLAVLWER